MGAREIIKTQIYPSIHVRLISPQLIENKHKRPNLPVNFLGAADGQNKTQLDNPIQTDLPVSHSKQRKVITPARQYFRAIDGLTWLPWRAGARRWRRRLIESAPIRNRG